MKSDEARSVALAEIAKAPSLRELNRRLENLPLSADAKAILADLARITVRVGSAIVAVGRKIIGFALSVLAALPSTSIGVIVALVVSALIVSVPLLGPVLGPVLGPLLVAFGLTHGALNDLRQRNFQARIENLVDQFQAALSPS